MMEEIKISVIMPVYNAEEYLREALDSVRNQTLKEIEIICVDDGSTDKSTEILSEYQEKDSRIKVLHQTEPSAGAALARNLGLQAAKGEYLSFLDADDLFEPDMLECTYRKAKETEADIVLFDAFLYDTRAEMGRYLMNQFLSYRQLPNKEIFVPADYTDNLFQMSTGAPWNKLFRRELIQSNRILFQPVHVANDIVFVYLALVCAEKIAVLRRRFVHYRKDANGNLTSNYSKWPKAVCQVFCHLKKELEDRALFQTYEVTYLKDFLAFSEWCLRQMRTLNSFKELYYALKDEYLEKLGVSQISEGKLVPADLIEIQDRIMQCEPEEYLFQITRNASWYSEKCFGLPYTWKKNSIIRTVLYGAGEFGRNVFEKLLDEPNVEVIGWVDQNFKRYGSYIKNPEEIRTLEYDCIFVAIVDENIFESVKQYLSNMGVEQQKIVWMNMEDI